jgi:chemotaxis protein methyltransferase CheR
MSVRRPITQGFPVAGPVGHDPEIAELLEELYERSGVDLRGYAPEHIRRRLESLLVDRSLASVAALRLQIRRPDAIGAVVGRLSSVDPTPFVPGELHHALREQVLPHLRTYPFINLWHAACGAGEETYAYAVMLFEEALEPRVRFYATDVSEHQLDRARGGSYDAASYDAWQTAYRAAGGASDLAEYLHRTAEHARVRLSLSERISFMQHDVTVDGSFNEFQLILCPRLLERLGPVARARALELVHDSLCPLGFLVTGPGGLGRHPHRDAYREVDPRLGIYRRTR